MGGNENCFGRKVEVRFEYIRSADDKLADVQMIKVTGWVTVIGSSGSSVPAATLRRKQERRYRSATVITPSTASAVIT
jgi:hypothetical protein